LVNLWLHREEREVKRRFYRHGRFKQVDRRLALAYLFRNPYRICRQFLESQGAEEVHVYGETPLTTLHRIVEEFSITPQDCVLELGSGRGRASFFLSEYVGCRVVAVEQVPQFVALAKGVAQKFQCNATFLCQDFMETDYSQATVTYLCGTCLPDSLVQRLSERLSGTVITVSYPLSAYSKKFVTKKQFSASFPWGETEIYLNVLH
jgi:SAM-dependent methyltransferase